MIHRILVVLAVALAVTVNGAPTNCSNPLFSGFGHVLNFPPGVTISQMSRSATVPNNKCNDYQGKEVCCPVAVINTLTTALNQYDNRIQRLSNLFGKIDASQIANVLKQAGVFTDAQINVIVDAINLYKDFLDPVLNCYSGLIAYLQGMVCFSCEVDWSQYYDAVQQVFTVAQSTCDNVYQKCSPMIDAVDDFASRALDLASDACTAFGQCTAAQQAEIAQAKQVLAQFNGEYLCRLSGFDNCRDYVCHYLISGLDIIFSANLIPDVPDIPTLAAASASQKEHPLVSVFHSLNGALVQAAGSVKPQPLGLQRLARAGELSNLMRPFLAKVLPAGHTQLAATSTVNQYSTSGGYDAYRVGCDSTMSATACQTYVEPSKNGLSKGMIALIVIVSILGAAAVCGLGVWCYRRRSIKAEGTAQYQSLGAQVPSYYAPPQIPTSATTAAGQPYYTYAPQQPQYGYPTSTA